MQKAVLVSILTGFFSLSLSLALSLPISCPYTHCTPTTSRSHGMSPGLTPLPGMPPPLFSPVLFPAQHSHSLAVCLSRKTLHGGWTCASLRDDALMEASLFNFSSCVPQGPNTRSPPSDCLPFLQVARSVTCYLLPPTPAHTDYSGRFSFDSLALSHLFPRLW